MNVLQRWPDLPDPRPQQQHCRLAVVFSEGAWYHCQKHWTSRTEPWKEEFGSDTVAHLKQNLEIQSADGQAVVSRVLGVLREQTREALSRPQALVYRSQHKSASWMTWHLVLPSGAVAILRGTGPSLRWVTCYYLHAAAVEKNRRHRWKAAVRQIIRRYVPLKGEPPQWFMPSPQEDVVLRNSEGKVTGRAKNLQFITPENWGFEPELKGCPWRGRLPSWPAAEEAQGSRHSRSRSRWLKPRRRWEESADADSVRLH